MIDVSVIVPVFNAERHLRDCLDSVLRQTVAVEVLCVDDGSSDGSGAILEEYAEAHSNVRVFRQRNRGPGPARNLALDHAEGRFVAFMDADDLYPDAEALKTLVQLADATGCKVAGGYLGLFADSGDVVASRRYAKAWLSRNRYPRCQGVVRFSEYQSPLGYQRYVFDRQMLNSSGIRFQPLRRFQDPPFCAMALHVAGSLAVTDRCVYSYRRGNQVIDWAANHAEKALHFLKGRLWILRFAREHGYGKLLDMMYSDVYRHIPIDLQAVSAVAAAYRKIEEFMREDADFRTVARCVHDGETVLSVFSPGCSDGRTCLQRTTLAGRIDTTTCCSSGSVARYGEFSFDVVACFVTWNLSCAATLDLVPALAKVLKPAGRLFLLVPVRSAAIVKDQASAYLIPEVEAPSRTYADCILMRFMRNPLVGRGVPLRETCWKIPDDPDYHMNAFNRDYLNPWLVRGIVSGCGKDRIQNPEALEKIRDEVLASYPADSVDAGAALCGKIYAADVSTLEKFIPLVEAYAAIPNPIPHQLRWQVSCSFALAVLAEKAGRTDLAKKWFSRVSDADVIRFSPTLGTKVMDACWKLANIALDEGETEAAKDWLRKSFRRADEILHASWLNVAGDVSCPVPIAYDELALICNKATRAAGMINVLDRYPERIDLARERAVSNAERLERAQVRVEELKSERGRRR